MNRFVEDSRLEDGETRKTEETGFCTNAAFLEAVFGKCLEARPMLVSFPGDPKSVTGAAWSGAPWQEDRTCCVDGANNYFSLATFVPDDSGHYRRKKAQFRALHAVMLDDLGGKVPLDRLTLVPSWLLETSPGNYQAGFFFREPLADGQQADRLAKAIIAAGLCDPGADGPRARLARLPVGVNGKHLPPFRCHLEKWAPELRYTVEELVAGLQLDWRGGDARPKRSAKDVTIVDGDAVWVPRPDSNPVLAALKELGLYKGALGGGRHDVTCPWVEEHTGAVDGGTAYFEPDDNCPIGGFKCQHGHCAERHIRDLLAFLRIEPGAARMKPTIRVVPGEIHRVADAAERELAHTGRYYQRSGLIVTVNTDPGTRETRIQEVSQPALVRAMAGAATWERFDGRSEDWTRTDPPARHASVLFDSGSYPHLPVLNGLARHPYLRPDGSVMTGAGYDPETGMFGVFDARAFAISDCPNRAEAEAALNLLKGLLDEFSFAGDVDRAAGLAAMLTAVLRPSLPVAPMFHVRAHMPGSGKSYLCQLISAFATPQWGTPTAFPADDEECRKLLLAEFMRGPAVLEFDNLTGDLVPHKSLCTALTSEFMTGRILGLSKTISVSTRTLILSSGNNVGPVQDMTRRCMSIHLVPQCENPATRSFARPHLVRDVLHERGRFVSAVLTIVRAWVVAGRPMAPCKALAGYGVWSDFCRQPLLWLGVDDPTGGLFEVMADEPERATLIRFMNAWMGAFGRTGAMVRDALNRVSTGGPKEVELRDVLEEIAGERGSINPRRLGWWIKRHVGHIAEGHRIARGVGNASSERWRVEEVASVSQVSRVSLAEVEEAVPAEMSVESVDGALALDVF